MGRLPEAVDAFSAACYRATGGNAFLLGELLGELAADGVEGAADEAGKVLEFGSERVGRAVRRRLRRLPAEATSVARAVAVLGPGSPLDEVAALAETDEAVAARAADALVGIHVLAAKGALDFVHPVVRSAVYEQIPPLERQALHVEAAEAPHGPGGGERAGRAAPAALCRRPPTPRAWRCCGRPPVGRRRAATPGRLRITCGARSRSHRAKRSAASCFTSSAWPRRPTASETASTATCARRWPRRAIRRARAQIALALGRARASFGDFRASAEVLDDALRGLDDPDGELGVALEAELLAISFHEFTSTELGAPHWDRRFAQLEAGEELDPSTLACLVIAIAASRGPAAAAIRLAERVLDAGRFDQPNSVVAGQIGNGLIYAGAPSRGARFYDETIADRNATGQPPDRGLAVGDALRRVAAAGRDPPRRGRGALGSGAVRGGQRRVGVRVGNRPSAERPGRARCARGGR